MTKQTGKHKPYMTLKKVPKKFLRNKRVLVRVDFNVPLDKKTNAIASDERIRAALPTINYLLKNKAKVILMSHLGRPDGKKDAKFTLAPVAERLSKLLKKKVQFVDDCMGQNVIGAVSAIRSGRMILLENLRFYKEEEANDPEFSKKLAALADLYVNDAFGTCHRAHASTYGVAKLIPSCAGFLLDKEIRELSKLIYSPKRPFVAVLGGAKVSDKIGVIQNLAKKADAILIGGAMMFTFYKAMGKRTGKSLVEDNKLGLAKKLLQESGKKIMLPIDAVIVEGLNDLKELKPGMASRVVSCDAIPDNAFGLDIGPETAAIYRGVLSKAKTVFWNGPLGYFEVEDFKAGSKEIAQEMAQATKKGAVTVIGGGDSIALIGQLSLELNFKKKFAHVSTGGGASLEFLEGNELPGIAVLEENKKNKSKNKKISCI